MLGRRWLISQNKSSSNSNKGNISSPAVEKKHVDPNEPTCMARFLLASWMCVYHSKNLLEGQLFVKKHKMFLQHILGPSR